MECRCNCRRRRTIIGEEIWGPGECSSQRKSVRRKIRKQSYMENGKRAIGKSRQISAKKKIIWSVDLVEVQKDEEGTSEQAYIKWALSRC